MLTDYGLSRLCTKFPHEAPIPAKGMVKFGIDPTFSRLHLGHLVPLRLVREMQRRGHPVTIVLGTFTAQLGDPSGRDTTRPILSMGTVDSNAIEIAKMVEKFLGKGTFDFFLNGLLHHKTSLPDFLKICADFTVGQMMARNAFQERQKVGHPIALHELLVPICQGWDSVHLEAAVEIGGQDQLFNFQVARFLQEKHGQTPQVCLMSPILRGTDGQKMSKSLNNCVFLDDAPEEMFGKVMSISDEVMREWIPLLSDEPNEHEHPMWEKMQLAYDITKQLHGQESASRAWEHFGKIVQNKEVPSDIPTISASTVVEAVTRIRQCSKGEARRLIAGGGIAVDGVKVEKDGPVSVGQVVKAGKRDFGRVA